MLYVKLNLDRHQRSFMFIAQLRVGILPLHIETGRFVNKKLQDRTCNICLNGNIEDECHFLFHCNYYDEERNILYAELETNRFHELSDYEKLKYLCSYVPRKLGKFIVKIFEKRKEKLYIKS